MKFQPGNELAKKRKTKAGGRPTTEQAKEKQLAEETAAEFIKKNSLKLARRLIADAMSERGRKSLHVAINKIVPDAKQQVGVEGSLTVVHRTNIPEK